MESILLIQGFVSNSLRFDLHPHDFEGRSRQRFLLFYHFGLLGFLVGSLLFDPVEQRLFGLGFRVIFLDE